MERNTLETKEGLVRILPLGTTHGELGDLKGYGLAHDTELNCLTSTTHGLARTAPLVLPGNLYPDSPPEICYGTDFADHSFTVFLLYFGVKLQRSAVTGSQLSLLCRHRQPTLSTLPSTGGQLFFILPSLADNSSLCRRWQTTLSLLLSKNWRLSLFSLRYDWSRRVARS